jgi:hypothetical protein
MKILAFLTLITTSFISFAEESNQLSFNWPKTKAKVIETISNNDKEFNFSYEVLLEKEKDGFLVKQSGIQLISVNGKPINNPTLSKQFSASVLFPTLRIGKTGQIIEVIDFENYMNELVKTVNKPEYTQLMSNPQFQEALYEKSADNWVAWVGAWTIPQLTQGKPVIEKTTTEFFGVTLPTTSTTSYKGKQNGSEHVLLTHEVLMEGDTASAAMVEATKELAKAVKSSLPEKPKILNIKRTFTIHAIVDPKTLMPISVETASSTHIKTTAEENSKKEKKKFQFSW